MASQRAADSRVPFERSLTPGLRTAREDLVEREQAARARAQAEVKQGKEDLRAANVELARSLQKTEAESLRASAAASDAQKLAASLQSTNERLEMLLRAERERAERLEHERSKILTELR